MLRILRSFASAMFAAIMAILTFVLTPGPLLVLREQEGRVLFLAWTTVLVVSSSVAGELGLLLPLGASGLLVFYFYELEAAGFSLRRSASLSVLASGLLIFFAFVVWVRHIGFSPIDFLHGRLEYLANQTKALPNGLQLEADQLFPVVPSIFFISLGVMLWLGLLIEPAFKWMVYRVRPDARVTRGLERFRVPSYVIWPFILSIVAAFVHHPYVVVQNAGLNVFNILTFIYFLQGVAILSFFFSVTRTGALWRVLIYVLLIGNLSPFLAGLGVADFWLDFRARLRRKATETTV